MIHIYPLFMYLKHSRDCLLSESWISGQFSQDIQRIESRRLAHLERFNKMVQGMVRIFPLLEIFEEEKPGWTRRFPMICWCRWSADIRTPTSHFLQMGRKTPDKSGCVPENWGNLKETKTKTKTSCFFFARKTTPDKMDVWYWFEKDHPDCISISLKCYLKPNLSGCKL